MDGKPRVLSDRAVPASPRGRWLSMRWHVLTTLACAATIALTLASPAASIVVTWLIAPAFHGTSNGAALTFLAIVTIGTLRLGTARPCAVSATPAERRGVITLLGVVLLGNAAAIVGHLVALDAVDVPRRFATYFWSGDTNTYSYWLHSHAGKAALTPWLQWLLPSEATYDFGRGFGGSLPSWIGATCGVTVAVGAALLLWLTPGIVARAGGGFAAATVTIVAGSNCLKTIVDGGPLTYRFLPCFIAFVAVASIRRRGDHERIVRQVVHGGASLLGAYCILWWLMAPAGSMVEPLLSLGALVSILALPPLVAAKAIAAPWAALRRPTVSLAAIVVCAFYLVTGALGPAVYLAPLPADYRATIVDPTTLTTRIVPVGGESPLEVYARFGEDPLKPRRVFLWAPDGVGATSFVFLLSLLRTGEPAATAEPIVIERTSAPELAASAKVVAARVADPNVPQIFGESANALTTNNYYVFLHLLAARLRALGFAEFAIAPLRDAADLRALRDAG